MRLTLHSGKSIFQWHRRSTIKQTPSSLQLWEKYSHRNHQPVAIHRNWFSVRYLLAFSMKYRRLAPSILIALNLNRATDTLLLSKMRVLSAIMFQVSTWLTADAPDFSFIYAFSFIEIIECILNFIHIAHEHLKCESNKILCDVVAAAAIRAHYVTADIFNFPQTNLNSQACVQPGAHVSKPMCFFCSFGLWWMFKWLAALVRLQQRWRQIVQGNYLLHLGVGTWVCGNSF